MNKEKKLIEKAAEIAIFAHYGQKRKESDTPYIIHPFMVALKLTKYDFPDAVIAAALVHDVLEDTEFEEKRLSKESGNEVLAIVKTINEDRSLSWEERKKMYIKAVENNSEEVKAISAADKIHNLESLISAYKENGPSVWENFNRGKNKEIWFLEQVLKALKKTWQHPLVGEYENLLKRLKKLI